LGGGAVGRLGGNALGPLGGNALGRLGGGLGRLRDAEQGQLHDHSGRRPPGSDRSGLCDGDRSWVR
jgi:hypothetical protein